VTAAAPVCTTFRINPYHKQRGWNSNTKTLADSRALPTQYNLERLGLLTELQCLLAVDHVTVRVRTGTENCADPASQKTHNLHYKNKYVNAR
jgi:hypothetical protein